MSDEHYFAAHPAVESAPEPVAVRLPDLSIDLWSDRGVFSVGAVDRGTEFLLRAVPDPPATGDLIDVGCGYGVIAVVMALRSPSATVWAVDVNERALDLTRRNAEAVGAGNVRVALPGDVPADLSFAAVYSNPPIRVGKAALHGLLTQWLGRLAAGAEAWLVVQRHLGGDSLAEWLTENGYPTERERSRQGYRLLRSVRGDATHSAAGLPD